MLDAAKNAGHVAVDWWFMIVICDSARGFLLFELFVLNGAQVRLNA